MVKSFIPQLIVSKDISRHLGYGTMLEAAEKLRQTAKDGYGCLYATQYYRVHAHYLFIACIYKVLSLCALGAKMEQLLQTEMERYKTIIGCTT